MYRYRCNLAIDHTKVAEDLVDFPVFLNICDESGIDGADLTPIFDELGASSLKMAVFSGVERFVEQVDWDTINRRAELHTALNISSVADTPIKIYYDSEAVDNVGYVGATGSTPAQNVWSNDFVFVSHMNDNPAGDRILDSTSNANHGSKGAGTQAPTEVDGLVGKAQSFDGNDDQITLTDNDDSLKVSHVTVEYYGLYNVLSQYGAPIWYSGGNRGWRIYSGDSTNALWWGVSLGGSYRAITSSNAAGMTTGQYYHVACSFDGQYSEISVDGVSKTRTDLSEFGTEIGNYGTDIPLMGYTSSIYSPNYINAETRISSTARGAGWIAATNLTLRDNLVKGGTFESIWYGEDGEFDGGAYTYPYTLGSERIWYQSASYGFQWFYGGTVTFATSDPYITRDGLIILATLEAYGEDWNEIPIRSFEVNETDRTPTTELTCEIKSDMLTAEQLNLITLYRKIRFNHWVGGRDFGFVGRIVDTGKTKHRPLVDNYDIKIYDETYDTVNKRFIDSYPKTDITTWSEIVNDVWANYGIDGVTLDGVETNSDKPNFISSNMDSLFDFMEEVAQRTGWRWKVARGVLRFWNPAATIDDLVLTSAHFKPDTVMDDQVNEIANVVYIPADFLVEDFEDEQTTVSGQAQYFLQYPPRKGSGVVEQYFKPQIYLDGAEINAENILPDGDHEADTATVVYSLENRFVRFNDGYVPVSAVTLKVVYDAQVPVMVERRDANSIDYFGTEIHHVIRKTPKPSKDEAIDIGDTYLSTHAFPLTAVNADMLEYRVKCGMYYSVNLEGSAQLMPCVSTSRSGDAETNSYSLSATFQQAPVSDADMVFDLFRRLEAKEAGNAREERLERYQDVGDSWEWEGEWELTFDYSEYMAATHEMAGLSAYIMDGGRTIYPA